MKLLLLNPGTPRRRLFRPTRPITFKRTKAVGSARRAKPKQHVKAKPSAKQLAARQAFAERMAKKRAKRRSEREPVRSSSSRKKATKSVTRRRRAASSEDSVKIRRRRGRKGGKRRNRRSKIVFSNGKAKKASKRRGKRSGKKASKRRGRRTGGAPAAARKTSKRRGKRKSKKGKKGKRARRFSLAQLQSHGAVKGRGRRMGKRARKLARIARKGGSLTPKQAVALVKAGASAAKAQGGTALARVARKNLHRRQRNRSLRATATAWRAAKKAQGLARRPGEVAYLRAAGLAGVPNPGLGALKGIPTLLPAVGVGGASFVALGALGHFGGKKIVEKVTAIPASVAPFVPAGITLIGTGVAYALTRNSKALSKHSLPILMGGGIAGILLALLAIKVKGADGTTEVSLASKLGLPVGEYTHFGEYTRMGSAGGRAGGIFAGTDDDAVFDDLRGTDDEPVFDDEATGVLEGGIFD